MTSPALVEYAHTKIIEMKSAARWREYERWTRRYIRSVGRQMQAYFREQEAEVIANINAGKSAFMKGPDSWLDLTAWQITLEEYGQLLFPEVIGDKGQKEIEELLIGVDFDVTNPRVAAFIERRKFRFAFDTNKTTMDALRKALREAVEAGHGIRELTSKVNDIFDFAKKYRAERIARSEVVRASNAGAENAYLQSGVVSEKEWIVSIDERTCPYCEPMQGRKVGVGMVFYQQGEILPSDQGDLRLDYEDIFHPPLHPNCRCTIAPVLA